MKIDFEHRVWQLEMDEVTVRQGEQIQNYTGLTPVGWYKSLLETEAAGWLRSMECLYWMIRQQNGEPGHLPDVPDFAPLKLMTAFAAGSAVEDTPGPDAEADPTKPADGSGATGQTA